VNHVKLRQGQLPCLFSQGYRRFFVPAANPGGSRPDGKSVRIGSNDILDSGGRDMSRLLLYGDDGDGR